MNRPYKHWSRDEVVREIRRLKKEGAALNSGHVARSYPALAYAARKYLGGWEEAIGAAGLDYSRIRRKRFWSRERIVERIKELHAAGEPVYVSYAEHHYQGLVGAATMHFGSWGEAIRAAGFDYSRIKRQKEWSKREIVREIKRMKREGLDDRVVELNRAAAQLAREIAGKEALVVGDMGPTGGMLAPLGTLSYEDVVAAFAEQAGALAEGGADVLLIETMSDLTEIEAAIEGARQATDLPIMATMLIERPLSSSAPTTPAAPSGSEKMITSGCRNDSNCEAITR